MLYWEPWYSAIPREERERIETLPREERQSALSRHYLNYVEKNYQKIKKDKVTESKKAKSTEGKVKSIDSNEARRLRLACGWSQYELAHKLGTTQTRISQIENSSDISEQYLDKIRRIMHDPQLPQIDWEVCSGCHVPNALSGAGLRRFIEHLQDHHNISQSRLAELLDYLTQRYLGIVQLDLI